MSDERLLLKSYLKTLKLPTVRVEYETVARRCNQADASYEEYLEQLVELEVQHRLAGRIILFILSIEAKVSPLVGMGIKPVVFRHDPPATGSEAACGVIDHQYGRSCNA